MTVTTTDPHTVTVTGDIDSHTAGDLEAALDQHPAAADVTLDLAAVTFVDSSGLRAIVRTHRRLTDGGGTLALREPSDPVRRLLDITGLAAELTIS